MINLPLLLLFLPESAKGVTEYIFEGGEKMPIVAYHPPSELLDALGDLRRIIENNRTSEDVKNRYQQVICNLNTETSSIEPFQLERLMGN